MNDTKETIESFNARKSVACSTCKGLKRLLVRCGTNGESEPCYACRGTGLVEATTPPAQMV